ncbi:MAG: DUF393 domain-containing protein [Rhodospirillales bacterium]
MTRPTDRRQITTYYNGSCPVCRAEISHYRRKRADGLDWRDISQDAEALQALGVSLETAKRRLHVRLRDGQVVSGVDAFLVIWQEMPGFRWLPPVIGNRLVKPVAVFLYDRLLAPLLYSWNRRAGR